MSTLQRTQSFPLLRGGVWEWREVSRFAQFESTVRTRRQFSWESRRRPPASKPPKGSRGRWGMRWGPLGAFSPARKSP
eukprot:6520687-Prymnesium_polylepis.1